MVKVKNRGNSNHQRSNLSQKSHQIQRKNGDLAAPPRGFKQKLKSLLQKQKNKKLCPAEVVKKPQPKKIPQGIVEIEYESAKINGQNGKANQKKTAKRKSNGQAVEKIPKKQKQTTKPDPSSKLDKSESKKKSKKREKISNAVTHTTPGKFVRPPPADENSAEESNSDDENYLERFFSDLDENEGESAEKESEEEESEPSEEDATDESDSDDERDSKESEEEQEMSVEDLMNYFGAFKDKQMEEIEEENGEETGDGNEEGSLPECDSLAKYEEPETSSEDEGDDVEYDEDWSDPSYRPEEYSDGSSVINGEYQEFYLLDDEFGDDLSALSSSSGDEEDGSSYYDSDEEPSLGQWYYSQSSGTGSDSDNSNTINSQAILHNPKDGQFRSLPENGAAITELDDDSDECPQLVPIPKSMLDKAKKAEKKTGQQKAQTEPELEIESADFYTSHNFQHVLVHIKDQLHFHGNLKIQLITGKVEIFGYILDDPKKEIYANASCGQFPILIKALPNKQFSIARSFVKEVRDLFHYDDLLKLKENFQDNQAILLLKCNSGKHLEFIKNNMNFKVFPDEFRKTYESILRANFFQNPRHKFLDNFSQIASKIGPKSRVVSVGGKNVGKTTFNRFLVNSAMNKHPKILYIDLDIGQPEFYLPQTISVYLLDQPIIGNGFFNQSRQKPDYSLLHGDLNVTLQPIKYFKSIKKLLSYVHSCEEWQNVPWVVNTMGYAKGFGAELIAGIIHEICPTEVVQFHHRNHFLENFSHDLTDAYVRNFPFELLSHSEVAEPKNLAYKLTKFDGISLDDDRWMMKGSEARMANILACLGSSLTQEDSLNEIEPIW